MDKLNINLLKELINNSRTPITQLAKKLRVSREVVNYRLNRLVKEGVIKKFITEININKLGFVGSAVFINVKATKQKKFKSFLESLDFVYWVAELSGVWSFGMSIIGKTNEELDENFSIIYEKFKEDIIDHRFTLHKKSTFYYQKYLDKKSYFTHPAKLIDYKIDKHDKVILKELTNNSRLDSISLSKKIPLTAPAISKRIKKLSGAGYIEKFSIFIDISKINLFQYSIFILDKNVEKNKLNSYLSNHPNVSFIAEYIGANFLEFGLIINDPYQLRDKLQEIEEVFPENRVIEISLFHKEFVSIGLPNCVFY